MPINFFSLKRRIFIANKLGEIGTAIVIAFVIGGFISNEKFNYFKFLIGFGMAIVFYTFATIVTPEN